MNPSPVSIPLRIAQALRDISTAVRHMTADEREAVRRACSAVDIALPAQRDVAKKKLESLYRRVTLRESREKWPLTDHELDLLQDAMKALGADTSRGTPAE